MVVGDKVLFGVAVRAPAPGFTGKVEGLYAVDAATGDLRWHAAATPIRSAPAVLDGTVYVMGGLRARGDALGVILRFRHRIGNDAARRERGATEGTTHAGQKTPRCCETSSRSSASGRMTTLSDSTGAALTGQQTLIRALVLRRLFGALSRDEQRRSAAATDGRRGGHEPGAGARSASCGQSQLQPDTRVDPLLDHEAGLSHVITSRAFLNACPSISARPR